MISWAPWVSRLWLSAHIIGALHALCIRAQHELGKRGVLCRPIDIISLRWSIAEILDTDRFPSDLWPEGFKNLIDLL